VPALESIVPYCAAHSTPATPAMAPLIANAVNTLLPTGMPASRAASGLDPMAYSSRPDRYVRR
jgi:hypothetical protein